MERFLGVEVDVAEAELDRAVRVWNPRFKNRHDGLTERQNVRDGKRPIPVGRGSPLRLQKQGSCQEQHSNEAADDTTFCLHPWLLEQTLGFHRANGVETPGR
jgi:hypothetical protein